MAVSDLDLSQVMADAAAAAEAKPKATVETVADLVARQIELEQMIEDQTKVLERLQADLRHVSERQLPDAMLELGVKRWDTQVGNHNLTVSLERTFYPSVTKADMPKLVSWLKERGDESIVKPKFVVDFEKGQVDEAERWLETLREMDPDLPVVYSPEIHWATFRSFTKEAVLGGDTLPDFYKYADINRSVIKKRKA